VAPADGCVGCPGLWTEISTKKPKDPYFSTAIRPLVGLCYSAFEAVNRNGRCKMGRNDALHERRARKAWKILAKRASARLGPLTYKQLCDSMNLHWRSAQWFLGVIQRHCATFGLPPLQALVVNGRTRIPGDGYTGSMPTRSAHAKAVKSVERRRWPRSAPF
jgi:putative restriction endonuclease